MTPYEDKTLKDRLREEKKKLKQMNLKDKLWYIWEYYKFPIISVIVAVFLVISIGSAVYNNRFETALNCVILNSRVTSQTTVPEDYFDKEFRQYIKLPEDTKIEVDHSMTLTFDESAMSDFTYAELAKLSAMISSKELDVIIGRKDSIDHFGQMGGFTDLTQLLTPQEYEKVKDRIYFVTVEETGEKVAGGILLDEKDFTKRTGLSIDQPILSVMTNSTHKDTAAALIRYMFGL
ncbi:hypothetical protein [Lacrimispora sp. JR3]|uniref:hypothetical protein n=1 Tax=Lacrimispora sinapis TaxID=3111456 RepID=UPI003749966C